MPDAAKQQLATLLATRKVALIEDDIYGDICFTGARPRPIHAFDTSGNTMLCTSFSKTVSPGLRVGFVAAGRRAADIVLQKTLTSGKTNALTQHVIAGLMDSRGFDVHLRTLRRRFAEQVARTRDAGGAPLPGGNPRHRSAGRLRALAGTAARGGLHGAARARRAGRHRLRAGRNVFRRRAVPELPAPGLRPALERNAGRRHQAAGDGWRRGRIKVGAGATALCKGDESQHAHHTMDPPRGDRCRHRAWVVVDVGTCVGRSAGKRTWPGAAG
jgi:hypothetical protein